MALQMIPKDKMIDMVGQKFEPSEWITIDQERINTFADCTEDHQFIHVDKEKAAQTPFGTTVAHGFLTLSMMTRLLENTGFFPEGIVMGLNYGCDKVRFLTPVKSGSRVRAHVEVMSVDQKDENRFLIKQNVTVEIEGEEKPALIAEWLSMMITG